jgi:hypothetical protein
MTYCYLLTDAQLEQVLLKEFDRYEAGEDSELYYEAREECARRDIDSDTIIFGAWFDLSD